MLPDGCVDLIWIVRPDGERALWIAGPDREAWSSSAVVGTTLAGVRLRPGLAGSVIGVAADELPARVSPLEDVWGRPARSLAGRLSAAGDLGSQRALLGQAIQQRLALREPDPLVLAAVDAVAGGARVGALGEAVSLSARQLQRRFRQQVGYGPKQLQRVLRLQRFLGLTRAIAAGRETLAGAAVALGYADQAHLTRECAELAGRTPRELVADWTS